MRTLVAVALVLLSAAAASGQKRTDVIVLANGDRITGEIKKLDRGRLEVKTDHAGTIDFEWTEIATVTATRRFEVATTDGRRFVGSLTGPADRQIAISELDGSVVTLPLAEVTNIVQIGASFWAKMDGSFDVGFNYTRSSGIAQTTINSSTVFRQPAFAIRLDGSATLTRQSDSDKRDDQSAVEFSYDRYRGRRAFLSGAGRLESNESLGLVLRSQVGGIVGLRLVNTNWSQLEVGAGLVGNREKGVDTEPTTNAEAVFAARYSYYTYSRPKTNVDASAKYYPSLSAWGRQRVQVDAGLKRELFKDFYAGFNGYYTLDTDPPNPSAARSDVGVTLSIGWTY